MTKQLVAVPTAGLDFVAALQRAWDDGDAVLPVDHRLPDAARDALLTALAPDIVISADGQRLRPGGCGVESGDALVVATSGSTGQPKGVILTHGAIAASARATSAALEITADDHWLACLPLSHIGGLSVVTRALHTGAGLTLHDRFDPAAVEAAARAGATRVSLVATALRRCDTSGFTTVLLGGSAIPMIRPANTVATYGMTETGSGVVYEGRPLDGVELRVVDDEIQVRGPMLLRAYRSADDPAGNDPLDADGWFATDDAGELHDGLLQVHGRRGDVIVSGGEKIWPAALEKVLAEHPLVDDVAVVGRPDAEWGQRVTAVVVARATAPGLEALRDHVKAQLPAAWAPKSVEIVDALPRTAIGKIRRSAV